MLRTFSCRVQARHVLRSVNVTRDRHSVHLVHSVRSVTQGLQTLMTAHDFYIAILHNTLKVYRVSRSES